MILYIYRINVDHISASAKGINDSSILMLNIYIQNYIYIYIIYYHMGVFVSDLVSAPGGSGRYGLLRADTTVTITDGHKIFEIK